MGKSLKEALLDQFALLQERGLAPSELPRDDERPFVVVEAAPRGRNARYSRDSSGAPGDRDDVGSELGEFDRGRPRLPRRDHRGEEAGDQRRPLHRAPRPTRPREPGEEGLEIGMPPPLGIGGAGLSRPPFRRPGGPPMAGRPDRPMGGPGGPTVQRPGGALFRPPMGRTDMLQQRSEQRRRDEQDLIDIRALLGEYRGAEIDDEALDQFRVVLTEETGALPPTRVVLEAMRLAKSGDPRAIADAVRAYYRRARSRPQAPVRVPAISAPV